MLNAANAIEAKATIIDQTGFIVALLVTRMISITSLIIRHLGGFYKGEQS